MILEINLTMATCAAISAASSNFALTLGLMSVILLELIIIIIIILTLIAVFATWFEKRKGVTELPPLNFMDLGGDDDDPWTKLKKKVKRFFGKR